MPSDEKYPVILDRPQRLDSLAVEGVVLAVDDVETVSREDGLDLALTALFGVVKTPSGTSHGSFLSLLISWSLEDAPSTAASTRGPIYAIPRESLL